MSDKSEMLILGGALVTVGMFIGRSMSGVPAIMPQVKAATNIPEAWSPFKSGRGAIMTTSGNGLTLHFWSPRGRDEQL